MMSKILDKAAVYFRELSDEDLFKLMRPLYQKLKAPTKPPGGVIPSMAAENKKMQASLHGAFIRIIALEKRVKALENQRSQT